MLRDKEINSLNRRRFRNVTILKNTRSLILKDELALKRQRFNLDIRIVNLNSYLKKNFKKH